jgi:hypothetical protein
MPVISKVKQWILSTGAIIFGGGIAGAFSAAIDRTKYQFPQDFGSGKLWKYFFMGCLLTFGGSLLRSPWGQKIMASFQASQQQLKQSREDLQTAQKDLTKNVNRP